MATLTIEYNPHSNFANALFSLIKSSNSVKVIETSAKKSPYDPKCVEEIKTTDRKEIKEMFLQKLTAAGKEAKQIAAGKKKGKTLDELLK
jgi:hypothetical protein